MNDQRCEMRDDNYALPDFLRPNEPQGAVGGQEGPNDNGKFLEHTSSFSEARNLSSACISLVHYVDLSIFFTYTGEPQRQSN